jgi:transcriptional regulator with XRE-family HTH domain
MARLTGTKEPQPVDLHVGGKIRFRRNLVGISQTELGDRIGVTFQQVQKYERGINRIGASRLTKICDVLQVTPAWLFEGAPGQKPKTGVVARDRDATFVAFQADPLAPRLMLAWLRIPTALKRSIVALMISLADAETKVMGRGRRRSVHISV